MLICHSLDILFLLEVKLRDRIFNFTHSLLKSVENWWSCVRCKMSGEARLAGNRLDSPVKQPAYQLTVSRYYQNKV